MARRYTSKVVKMAKGGMSKAEKAEVRALEQEQRAAVQAAKAEGASRAEINEIKATNTAALNEAKTFLRQEGVQSLANRANASAADPSPVAQQFFIPEAQNIAPSPAVTSGSVDIPSVPSPAPTPETRWRDLGTPEGATDRDIRRAERQDRAEFRSAQSSEIKMLESVLRERGFSNAEIKRITEEERKENKAERQEFVAAQKQPGLQLWNMQFTRPATAQDFAQRVLNDPTYMAENNLTPAIVQDALNTGRLQAAIDSGALQLNPISTGNNYSAITSRDIPSTVINDVLDRLEQGAGFLRENNLPQLYKRTSGDATISTGLGLEQAYALSQAAADGMVTPDELVGDFFGKGGANRWAKRYDVLQRFSGDTPITSESFGDIKLKPIKGEDDLFRAKLQGGGENRMDAVFRYDPEAQTYTPVSFVPTKVQVDDGGFLSSLPGQLLLGGLSLFAGPYLATAIRGLGASPMAANALAGAGMGAIRSGLTGGDILKGALSGGFGSLAGDVVGGLESVQGLRNVFPGVSPYFDLPTALASGAANVVGSGIMSDFDPLSTLAGGASGFVGGGFGGVPNVPRANANAAFSPNVQNALASGAASLTNSLIRSGGDIGAALQSGFIGAGASYLPTQITPQLTAAGLGSRAAGPAATGITNYLIGSALGDPFAGQRAIQSGLQQYLAPYLQQGFNAVTGAMGQLSQQPTGMNYNPYGQPR